LIHLPNRFLTLAAPTPTNISSNSAPEQKKNGTPASPATAFASNVFPVPGDPTNNIPATYYKPMSDIPNFRFYDSYFTELKLKKFSPYFEASIRFK
jgi:hypothetical protein